MSAKKPSSGSQTRPAAESIFSSAQAQYQASGLAAGQIKFELPDLIKVQKDSYDWFWRKGLKELLDEFSPIRDWGEEFLELYFLDYRLEEPKYTEIEAKTRNVSYEAPLYCRVKLVNKKTKESKEQEVFLGDFPLMTERGTFIVNAVERVVISQLIRSSGAFFTSLFSRGQQFFGAKVIPNRGAWLELETDSERVIGVKIDRKRKVPVTALLRVFAALDEVKVPTNDEIKKLFTDVNKGEHDYIEATLAKDTSQTDGESFVEVYKRIRPGDLATEDNARSFIRAMFSFERYDLGEVGRWKMSQRLDFEKFKKDKEKKRKEIGKNERVLHYDDLIAFI